MEMALGPAKTSLDRVNTLVGDYMPGSCQAYSLDTVTSRENASCQDS